MANVKFYSGKQLPLEIESSKSFSCPPWRSAAA